MSISISSNAAPHPPPTASIGPKLLQDLAAAKAIQALHEDEDAIQTWNSLESTTQMVLFPHLWKDYHHLQKLRVYLGRRNSFRSRWRYYKHTDDFNMSRVFTSIWNFVDSNDPKRPLSSCSLTSWDNQSYEVDLRDHIPWKTFTERLTAALGAPPQPGEDLVLKGRGKFAFGSTDLIYSGRVDEETEDLDAAVEFLNWLLTEEVPELGVL